MSVLYIIIGILMFGVLIAVHEAGHFGVSKLFHIKVNEFSIGMGPTLWHKDRGETQYSLRLLPIGGFCAIEGEDGESDDPRAFPRKPIWQRVCVLAAGSAAKIFARPALKDVLERFPEYWRIEGDIIVIQKTSQFFDEMVALDGKCR